MYIEGTHPSFVERVQIIEKVIVNNRICLLDQVKRSLYSVKFVDGSIQTVEACDRWCRLAGGIEGTFYFEVSGEKLDELG